jgi:hypothetical protein
MKEVGCKKMREERRRILQTGMTYRAEIMNTAQTE